MLKTALNFFVDPAIKSIASNPEGQTEKLHTTWIAARALSLGVVGYGVGRALIPKKYSLIFPAVATLVVGLLSYVQGQRALSRNQTTRNEASIQQFVNDLTSNLKPDEIEFKNLPKEFVTEQWNKLIAYDKYRELPPAQSECFNKLVVKIFNVLDDKPAAFENFLNSTLVALKLSEELKAALEGKSNDFETIYPRLMDEAKFWGQPNNGLFNLDNTLNSLWTLVSDRDLPQEGVSLDREVAIKHISTLGNEYKETYFINLIDAGNSEKLYAYLDRKIITANDLSPKVLRKCWTSSNNLRLVEALLKAGAQYNIDAVTHKKEGNDALDILPLFNQYPQNFIIGADKFAELVQLVKAGASEIIQYLDQNNVVTWHDLFINHLGFFANKNADFKAVWNYFLGLNGLNEKLINLWQSLVNKKPQQSYVLGSLIGRIYEAFTNQNQKDEFKRIVNASTDKNFKSYVLSTQSPIGV